MIQFLQLSVSVIFFLNKILVVIGTKKSKIRRIGWFLGVIGASLSVAYFLILKLYVLTVLEFGLIGLMGYGFLAKENKNPRVEKLINLLILIVMATLTYFVSVGILTVMELGGSIGLLFGTYYLTHSNPKLGWILYAFGHGCAIYVGYHKLQWVFAFFQALSILVSVYGLFKKEKQQNKKV